MIKPIVGVPLVKVFDGESPSKDDDAMASDVCDLLQEGLRGSTDTDMGGVEGTYLTTLEKSEADRTEREFMSALARRIGERCPWANGKRGMTVLELGTRDGWRFSVFDKEGRPFEVEVSFSSIAQVAQRQRKGTLSNFHATLDHVCDELRDARVTYFSRLKSASADIH